MRAIKPLFWIFIVCLNISLMILVSEFAYRGYNKASELLTSQIYWAKKWKLDKDSRLALLQNLQEKGLLDWSHPLLGSTNPSVDLSRTHFGSYHEMLSHLARRSPKEFVKYRSIKTNRAGETIFDVNYTVDKQYRRKTVHPRKQHSRRLLLSGCSYTFGVGLEDHETFASNLASMMPDTEVVNLGLGGGSIARDLTWIKNYPERAQLSKDLPTTAVSVIIPTHLERIGCGVFCLKSWNRHFALGPRFVLEEGQLTSPGAFKDFFPWSSKINFWSFFSILELLPQVPRIPSESMEDLVVALYVEYKKQLQSKMNLAEFIVLNADEPSSKFGTIPLKLREKGIIFIDIGFEEISVLLGEKGRIPIDRHPSPAGAYAMAWMMKESLEETLARKR